ncbi:MAG: IS256 family transposase [Deltaproteobacteria bacterium]|nr:IS256 family transposase [Deltaproteobacteria bacterium]
MKKITKKSEVRQGVQQLVLDIPEIVGRELHEIVVGAGMSVLAKMLEAEREKLCGPRYVHSTARTASRGGHADGAELALGGRRVAVKRPRVIGKDGHEVKLRTWEILAGDDALHERAVKQMVIGVSTRKYARSLEDVDDDEVKTRGTSKSAVSRRFVALTQAQLDKMMDADLKGIDLVALMIDGIVFSDHVVLIALGIDVDGKKHILGMHEGATENGPVCTALLTNLRDRGMPTDRSILVVIDGGKALRKAVGDVFGKKAVVQRCQVHKCRNVVEHLPEAMQANTKKVIRQAYKTKEIDRARRQLENLARALEKDHPSAAASVREGLEETLTIKKFALPDALTRTLSTTNPIENLNGGIRRVCKRVTTWKGGTMILRWVGASLVEHARGFRRLRGHAGMRALVAALRARDGAEAVDQHRKAA